MTGTLLLLAVTSFACENAGHEALAPCAPQDAAPLTPAVAEPVAVAEHLLHPGAEALDPLAAILYDDTVSVTEYGVRADGSTDNTSALQRAIDAVAPGTALFFPAGAKSYVLRGTVRLRSHIGLVSDGATIDSRGNDGTAVRLGDVTGVEIAGLRFLGPTTPDTYSRAITIGKAATGNLVRDSYFRGYVGGAVVVQGSGNTIRDNTFVEVNNSPPEPGAHYGSIHLLGASRNVVIGNEITDFDYSGISLYASDDNRIAGNVVRARAGFPGESMGIYILAGSSGNLIEGNEVSLARNECIVLISNGDVGAVERNVVRNNDVADCPYAGISLQKNGSQDVRGNLIENNRIEAFGLGDRHIDHAILLVGARDNIVRGNEVHSDGRQIETGIRTMDGADGNVFEANRIEGVSGNGIIATGAGSRYVGNAIRDAETGIFVASARDAVITGNAVSGTARGSIRVGSDVAGARVYDNRLDRPVLYAPNSGVTVRDNIVAGCR
ncbi:MAG TPA: right-handed parallel beta-helix repeat-containing protein [Longimicrobiales bacterium]